MRNPNDHLGENERVKKSEQQQVRHKTCNQEVSGSLTLWSCKTMANKRAKTVCCTRKIVFCCLLDLLLFFHHSRCLRRLA